MDFGLSDDQKLLEETLRGFLADRVPIARVRELRERDCPNDREIWRQLAELGACGILVPEAHGGSGLGLLDGSHCPHYDADPRRRATYHRLIASGELPPGHAAEVDVAIRVIGPRNAVAVRDGTVEGLAQGEFEIVATVVVSAESGAAPPTLRVPVVVSWPAIDRVEILRDGASAQYGSDAIAGVVNFILRDDFDGFGLDASVYSTEQGDSTIYDINATSLYRDDIVEASGVDAMSKFVDFIQREFRKEQLKMSRQSGPRAAAGR